MSKEMMNKKPLLALVFIEIRYSTKTIMSLVKFEQVSTKITNKRHLSECADNSTNYSQTKNSSLPYEYLETKIKSKKN